MDQKRNHMKVVKKTLKKCRDIVLAIQFGSIQAILDVVIHGEERGLNDFHCILEGDAIAIVDETSAFKA